MNMIRESGACRPRPPVPALGIWRGKSRLLYAWPGRPAKSALVGEDTQDLADQIRRADALRER